MFILNVSCVSILRLLRKKSKVLYSQEKYFWLFHSYFQFNKQWELHRVEYSISVNIEKGTCINVMWLTQENRWCFIYHCSLRNLLCFIYYLSHCRRHGECAYRSVFTTTQLLCSNTSLPFVLLCGGLVIFAHGTDSRKVPKFVRTRQKYSAPMFTVKAAYIQQWFVWDEVHLVPSSNQWRGCPSEWTSVGYYSTWSSLYVSFSA